MLDSWMTSAPHFVQSLNDNAYVAVGTFFVLSGFVLARSYASKGWNRTNLTRYGIARFARVYPVYLLSLVLITPIIYETLVISPEGRALPNKAGLVLNYVFLLQGWTGDLPVFWNTPAWSLSCELFFYLCFPLVILLLRTTAWHRILALLAASLALPFLLRQAGMSSDLKPLSNFGDFLIGIAAAGFYERSKAYLSGRGYWLYLPAAVLALTVTSAPHLIAPWMRLDSAMRVLNAILLVGLALGGGFAIRAFSTPLALLLGKTSYAIYILHIPLLWWYKRTWFYESGVLPLPFAGLAYIILVVAVAIAVFILLEEPANNRLRDFLSSRLSPAPQVAKAKMSGTATGQELQAEQPLDELQPRRRGIPRAPRLGRAGATMRT